MSEQTMKATLFESTGGPDVLVSAQVDILRPGHGEVLVRTAAIGVNFIETYQRSGVYPVQLPFIPGTEATGTVVALGEGVTSLAVGNRIAHRSSQRHLR